MQGASSGTVTSGLNIGGAGQPSTPTSGLRAETEEFSEVSSAAEAADIDFD